MAPPARSTRKKKNEDIIDEKRGIDDKNDQSTTEESDEEVIEDVSNLSQEEMIRIMFRRSDRVDKKITKQSRKIDKQSSQMEVQNDKIDKQSSEIIKLQANIANEFASFRQEVDIRIDQRMEAAKEKINVDVLAIQREVGSSLRAMEERTEKVEQQLKTVVANTSGRGSFVPGEVNAQSTRYFGSRPGLSIIPAHTAARSEGNNVQSENQGTDQNVQVGGTSGNSNVGGNCNDGTCLAALASQYFETEEDRFRTRLRKQTTHVVKFKGMEDKRNICAFLKEVELHMWRHARNDRDKVDMLFNLIDHEKNEWSQDVDFWNETSQEIVLKIRRLLWDPRTQNLELQRFYSSEYSTSNCTMSQYIMYWYERLRYIDSEDEVSLIDHLVSKLPNRIQCAITPDARVNISLFKKKLQQIALREELSGKKKIQIPVPDKNKKDGKNDVKKKHLNSITSR